MNITTTIDILVTRKSETGYNNADWQSLTDGVGGYEIGSDLKTALHDYLIDVPTEDAMAEGDLVDAATEYCGMIETNEWAYTWSEIPSWPL